MPLTASEASAWGADGGRQINYAAGLQFDAQGRPFYPRMDGKPDYLSPQQAMGYRDNPKVMAWLKSMGVTIDADGFPTNGSTSGPGGYDGGGYFRHATGWDSSTGTWKKGGLDWWNIGTTAAALIPIGAGTLSMAGYGAVAPAAEIGVTTSAVPAGLTYASATGAAAAGATTAATVATSAAAAKAAADAAAAAKAAGTGGTLAKLGLSGRDYADLLLWAGGTVADIYSKNKQVEASDRAAEIQGQSAKEALAFLKEQWEQDRKDFAPFLAMGTTASTKLNTDLAGSTRPQMPPSVLPRGVTMAQFGQPTPGPGTTGPGPGTKTTVPWDGVSRTGVPVDATRFTVPASPGGRVRLPESGFVDPLGAPPPQGIATVKLQAPDGSVRDVPGDRVEHYLQLGARRVA